MIAALALLKRFWPYLVAALLIALIVWAVAAYIHSVREDGIVQGRAEVTAEWTAAKLVQAEASAKLVAAARSEEQTKQQAIIKEKEKGDAEREKLAADVVTFQRDNARLRVSAAAVCKRATSVSVAADPVGAGTSAGTVDAERAGPGEINLDDIAGEIGRLGADLQSTRIRLNETLGKLRVCVLRMTPKEQ